MLIVHYLRLGIACDLISFPPLSRHRRATVSKQPSASGLPKDKGLKSIPCILRISSENASSVHCHLALTESADDCAMEMSCCHTYPSSHPIRAWINTPGRSQHALMDIVYRLTPSVWGQPRDGTIPSSRSHWPSTCLAMQLTATFLHPMDHKCLDAPH